MWVLGQPWALGAGVDPGKPIVGSLVLDTGRRYYLVALAAAAVALWVAHDLHRSGVALRLLAVRRGSESSINAEGTVGDHGANAVPHWIAVNRRAEGHEPIHVPVRKRAVLVRLTSTPSPRPNQSP